MSSSSSNSSIILEERKDLLIVLLDGKVAALSKTPYTVLKHKYFQGKRIIYAFNNSEMELVETYDDGIFNAYLKSAHLQIRKRDQVAEVILNHHDTGDTTHYERLFGQEYAEQNRLDLLKHLLLEYRQRVRFSSSGNQFEVDSFFSVDQHGNAHVRDDPSKPAGWRNLCLVAQGQLTPRYVETPIGPVQLDEKGLTILAKVLFLLNPNLEDQVFTRQISEKLRRMLEHNAGRDEEDLKLEV
ncbi:MAG: hypothetical protein M1503_03090 [Thaumarchaeota archaeon]|nr:hypothetical protein [Nitrososphaerota archaeon]MCL5317237.1 hypothetical protein [Nitrososphaerota archaeon]